MAGLWRRLFGGGAPGPGNAARAALEAELAGLARPGVTLRAGGGPRHASRAASWWGGNFIAEASRPGLVPLVQLCAAELPGTVAAGAGADFLLVWADPRALAEARWQEALEIALLPAPAHPAALPPVEQLCRLQGAVACLPLFAGPAARQLPHWSDLPAALRDRLAAQRGWYERLGPPAPEDEEPVSLGGWPRWFGAGAAPPGGRFMLELRSTRKGRLALPGFASLYLFRQGSGWQVRADRP